MRKNKKESLYIRSIISEETMPDFSGVQVFTCNLRSARPLELRLTTQGRILRTPPGAWPAPTSGTPGCRSPVTERFVTAALVRGRTGFTVSVVAVLLVTRLGVVATWRPETTTRKSTYKSELTRLSPCCRLLLPMKNVKFQNNM